ncbi:hypothetical protein [Amphritea balenae]|uniref:Uncharacterized protein n=1 Tax=Amphritea balenae TaxID=452629 RepID=A0A3P1SJY9_9GAMM|nr:hypothetical protein [Amphritea balenae]RRC97603.1 hypothetical protein EHS89_17365 [Amphritea balenae]GGK73755.1 hypothetical protein GCM10007941_24780 [Amphritea balenae]
MKSRIISIASWVIVLWIAKVFLGSLPYKFTNHPDTQHIFSTIGGWMSNTVSTGLGNWFTQYGAYAVGSAELIVSVILLLPAIFFILKKLNLIGKMPERAIIHSIGGIMASAVMLGAVFFHLATPLGIVVLHNGQSDNGSLFYAAVSILVLGFTMALVNFTHWRSLKSAS